MFSAVAVRKGMSRGRGEERETKPSPFTLPPPAPRTPAPAPTRSPHRPEWMTHFHALRKAELHMQRAKSDAGYEEAIAAANAFLERLSDKPAGWIKVVNDHQKNLTGFKLAAQLETAKKSYTEELKLFKSSPFSIERLTPLTQSSARFEDSILATKKHFTNTQEEKKLAFVKGYELFSKNNDAAIYNQLEAEAAAKLEKEASAEGSRFRAFSITAD